MNLLLLFLSRLHARLAFHESSAAAAVQLRASLHHLVMENECGLLPHPDLVTSHICLFHFKSNVKILMASRGSSSLSMKLLRLPLQISASSMASGQTLPSLGWSVWQLRRRRKRVFVQVLSLPVFTS